MTRAIRVIFFPFSLSPSHLLVMAVIPVAVAVTIPRVFEALRSVYPATCPILRDQDTVEKRARGGVPVVMGRFVAVDHYCHHVTVRRERTRNRQQHVRERLIPGFQQQRRTRRAAPSCLKTGRRLGYFINIYASSRQT